MPRLAVIAVLGALVAGAPARAVDPHLDWTLLPTGCAACHEGHGAARSPMLPAPQSEVCLACHGTKAKADEQVRLGRMSPAARPQLLGPTVAQGFLHPLTQGAFSRSESGAVTCTACHSPHRRSTQLAGVGTPGTPKPSTRNPSRLEHELCEQCHGNGGPSAPSGLDLSRRFDPTSRSFHPVHAPTIERSPSVVPALAGRRVNCSDCHANSLAGGPRGPHGSTFAHLLPINYVTVDGSPESPTTYQLCYACHDRAKVLDGPLFRLHRMHVVDNATSCATCHGAHGSMRNRALIRFGEETTLAGVAPSATNGRLEFTSDLAGRGSCSLTCHGVDHGPKFYGAEKPNPDKLALPVEGSAPGARPPVVVTPNRERPGERAPEHRIPPRR